MKKSIARFSMEIFFQAYIRKVILQKFLSEVASIQQVDVILV